MKKLALFLMLGVMPAFGQVYNATALQKMTGNWIQAVPFAQIKVCTSAATGNPCSPLATAYTDQNLSNVINQTVNPITADAFGNYTFYVQPGIYLVCVNGASTSRCDYISTGGFSCGTAANPGLPIWNGTACLLDTNATDDGNGNLTAVSVSAGTFTTTGVGWTKTFKTQAAPSNPPSGSMTMYGDSGTSKWACLNSDGSSCAPGGSAFSGVTAGTNSNAGNFIASGNSWDFQASTLLRLRVSSGCTTTVVGDLCYDNGSSAKMWHIWQNGADNFLPTALASGTFTDQDCVKFTKTGTIINLADSGGACGGSGSASPILFGGASLSSTVTDFMGTGIVTSGEASAQTPVPRAGTVSNLQCRVGGTGLSASQTLTFTVRKGAASITPITSTSQTMTCQMNSTNTAGCSDGTHNFTVAAGDVLDVQIVPANSPSAVTANCSVQLL